MLCGEEAAPFCGDRQRDYLRCAHCDLVFVPREQLVSIEEERARYARHHNTADDPTYLEYVDSCIAELRRLPLPGARILDFGCGEHAVMTGRLRALGLDCRGYDPVYGIGAGALARGYDVIAAIETVEHLREPRDELARLAGLLAPGGHLFVRTSLRDDESEFLAWWYKNDPTHVNFFSQRTLRWLAGALGLDCSFCDGRQCAVLTRGE